MQNRNIVQRRRPGLCLAGLCMIALLAAAPAAAEVRLWNNGSGWWDNDSLWNPIGQPQNGDVVYLMQSDSINRSVWYSNTRYPSAVLFELDIEAFGSGTMTFWQGYLGNNDSLFVDWGEYIGQNGTGIFRQTAGLNKINRNLMLGGNPGSSGNYELSGTGSLYAQNQDIGDGGTGIFTQTGGTNTVTDTMWLGYSPSGSESSGGYGTYNLSGTGSLSVNTYEYIGDGGTGIFKQTGGTHKASQLYIGNQAGSSGSYELSGTGSSLETTLAYIGYEGSGSFTQTGGTHTNKLQLNLGTYAGGSGTYELSGGSLSMVYDLIVGGDGVGTFTQTGGAVKVDDTLWVSHGYGSGTYNLLGGTLTAETIKLRVGGTFNQNEGTLLATTFNQEGGTVNGALENRGTFNYSSGTFNGRLLNYGTANFSADFNAGDGMAHYTNLSLPLGRTLTLNGQGLDNSGSFNLAGGVLTGNGPLVNYAFMGGYGTISGSGGFINYNVFSQSGGPLFLNNTGANANYGEMELATGTVMVLGSGASLANCGFLNLNQASITGAGSLDNSFGGTIYGRGAITSNFSNSAGVLRLDSGTTAISKPFGNGGLIYLTGPNASLTGGAIANAGTIRGQGQVGNSIANTGIIEVLGGNLTLSGASVSNQAHGLMTVSSGTKLLVTKGVAENAGTIEFNGGTFDNNNYAMSNTGLIAGYGTFRSGGLENRGFVTLTGGATTVNGNVTNEATGSIHVSNNPAIFMGNTVNYGTVKTTSTTVTWAGSFTNSGAYISDPSVNSFSDLTVSPTGYIVGGVGDLFKVSNDLINQSAQNSSWNTQQAMLSFISGADKQHDLYLAGKDLGPISAGYANNFAWGTLDLTAQSLMLKDGNAEAGGALYVGEITGLTFGSPLITNIYGNGMNIYYDPSLLGNDYLGGLTYDLNGELGGQLVPTPLPASAWLFLSGLAGLGLMRRGRKSKKS